MRQVRGQPVTGRGDKERARAVLHLAFICELHEMQVHGGRYFLHTHSHSSADSREQQTVVDFMNRFSDTSQTVTDQSSFGPKCPSRCGHADEMPQQLHSDLCAAGTTDPPQHCPLLPKLDILAVVANEEPQQEWEAEDDVKGGLSDPHEVKAARQKATQCLWDMQVCEYSTEAESRARMGRNPVGFKWIDTHKGSAEVPRCRSRLMCTEVRHKGVEPIISATPPLETIRVLLCVACQEEVSRVKDPFPVSIADVSRAHFHADAVREVYVRLPEEDPKAKQPVVCGKLRKTAFESLMQPNGGESITLKS